MKKFWVSWIGDNGVFELHSPWWVSGYSDDKTVFCAAIQAENQVHAEMLVLGAHDEPKVTLAWRFVEEKPDDWSPFNERFRKADWMVWP